MCVAILCKTGKILDNERLYRGWTNNSDGGGIAYLDDNKKVCIESGFLQYGEFQKAYARLADRYSKNGPMLIHMRIRSTGSKGKDNCHPFKIKNGAMIHNGTLFFPTPPKDAEAAKVMKCDSRIFAETFYNILDREVLARAANKILDIVGSYNKLVFLYDGGEHLIINEKEGYWDDDQTVWFSNSTCRVKWGGR